MNLPVNLRDSDKGKAFDDDVQIQLGLRLRLCHCGFISLMEKLMGGNSACDDKTSI